MPFTPTPFTQVTLTGEFWTPRLRTNREQTIPIEYEQCLSTGRIGAFRLQWQPGQDHKPHVFWDSDVAKWLEAASYSLGTHPDPRLEKQVDEVIALIASAQQPDGYLNTHFTVVEPEKRWSNLRDLHEMYCAGHLIEAAVAHSQATGKFTLLDVLRRYADHIDRTFGPRPGQKRGYCGHEEIELALVKLYHATGEPRYLALSQYFINERSREPHYYDIEAAARGEDPSAWKKRAGGPLEGAQAYAYMQAHAPVRDQMQVTGHAVRAMYLYSAMADLARETGDASLRAACERLWRHLCTRNIYLTGGIGPTGRNEGFSTDYDLPNESAYAETCAAVGLVFWSQRMLQFDCDSQYADTLERTLYNGVLSGVSLDGTKFFYDNPLASQGSHHRQPWFDCACCPPNLARLLAALGGYVYSQNATEIAVHLYTGGTGQFLVNGQAVTLHQETSYPWEGLVKFQVEVQQADPLSFGLRLRIPGWSQSARLRLNGAPVEIAPLLEHGYARLERAWHHSDLVELDLDMPIQRIYAHPDVRENSGKIALQRGPLVYCLEQTDHGVPLQRIVLPESAPLSSRFEPNLLGGVTVITGEALAADGEEWGGGLYRPRRPVFKPFPITAIPYYAWDNRQPGSMRVWLPAVSS